MHFPILLPLAARLVAVVLSAPTETPTITFCNEYFSPSYDCITEQLDNDCHLIPDSNAKGDKGSSVW
ncbi:hypothetical protein LTR05_005280, partial [Lithohypha guttulata]